MGYSERRKLVRVTTVPISLRVLLKGQLRFMSRSFDIVAVSSSGPDLIAVGREQAVRTVGIEMTRKITPIRDLISLGRMVRLFLKERPYIIHSHTPKAGTVSMLAGWVARVPHRVHTVAGLPLTEATGLKRWLLIEIEKVTLSCATNVLVNSTQLSEFMIKTGLCDTSKLKVLGHGSSNGIDTDFFFATSELRAKAKTIRQSLGIPAKSLMFCFVGRMVADKGLDELISAFVSISKECSAYLLLVGPFEEDLDPLTSESRRLNVGWMATTELSSNQRTLLDWKTQCV